MPRNLTEKTVRDAAWRWRIFGLVIGLTFFLLTALWAYANVVSMRENEAQIRETHEVLSSLDDLLAALLDAETGQRGYLLTGRSEYLGPYVDGLAESRRNIARLDDLLQDRPLQQDDFSALRQAIDTKVAELARVIDLRREQGIGPAIREVSSDRGKIAMDTIRARLAQMRQEEGRHRQESIERLGAASRMAVISAFATSLLGMALTITVFVLVSRAIRNRERQRWLQDGQVALADAMRGEKSLAELAYDILACLAERTGAHAGALFKGEAGVYRLVATLGVPADAGIPQSFSRGEGLLGKVASDARAIALSDVPAGYFTIGSALGRDDPAHLVIAAAEADGVVNAVIELGFFEGLDEQVLELLDQASASIGIALRSARFRERLRDALEETQRQAGELQAQSEELRVSNEELEEQGNALKESQARLELQQVELEQTNTQLEEQTQELQSQRDELSRIAADLEQKARELEQASQYKSDFLANMSHELRTPLNSLLILSKLLGDNPDENLSEEQVKFARTIESAGNDLLTLINDILDLSKIEAGHVEIEAAPLPTDRLVAGLHKTFDHLAQQRGLAFEVTLAPDCPQMIETDRTRLEQVLKNLLSNAIKFTERGKVAMTVGRAPGDMVQFAVSDTGIGIAEDKRDAIFEAFRQADGTINRKFGGTGLGLSISRELVRLLGGTIRLDSKVGEGSTFTVAIPVSYDPARAGARSAVPAAAIPASAPAPVARKLQADLPGPAPLAADRGTLDVDKRLLLVIEDDPTFAAIVCEISREMGFECVVAGTAQDAIDIARDYRPSAIILDLGLPDQSGLTVLDRLKHQDETRHIPIHVVSGADQTQAALALGAVGFLGKPAAREQLAEVLSRLQEKLASRMRRILIVEDDEVQRESVGRLLASQDVETVGVGSAAACLAELRRQDFDCMVLDLSLPDASGFSLLETLSNDPDQAFPPVIVYTGRDLSADEEQRLRRYSSSIIVKGAKSPERLLDEVSLFLHRVMSELPPEQRQMIQKARHRDAALEGRRILVVEDDVRNVYSLTSVLEPRGAVTTIARNGQEALDALAASASDPEKTIDLVLMDVMMPVMDGLTAVRTLRKDPKWRKLPIVMLTAKAMPDDQQKCLDAGANDYMAKPIDVEKLLSLVRVWMPR